MPARGWRALLPGLSLALAAVLLAAAAASGVVALRAEHRLGQAELRDHGIARVLNAPDVVMLTARVHSGGTVTVVMSRRDRSLVFTTAGLPPLTSAHCYQLWLMGPGGDRSAGMLPAPHRGMTSPVIATGLAVGDWVGLTVEPAGGSPRPTSRPVLMLRTGRLRQRLVRVPPPADARRPGTRCASGPRGPARPAQNLRASSPMTIPSPAGPASGLVSRQPGGRTASSCGIAPPHRCMKYARSTRRGRVEARADPDLGMPGRPRDRSPPGARPGPAVRC